MLHFMIFFFSSLLFFSLSLSFVFRGIHWVSLFFFRGFPVSGKPNKANTRLEASSAEGLTSPCCLPLPPFFFLFFLFYLLVSLCCVRTSVAVLLLCSYPSSDRACDRPDRRLSEWPQKQYSSALHKPVKKRKKKNKQARKRQDSPQSDKAAKLFFFSLKQREAPGVPCVSCHLKLPFPSVFEPSSVVAVCIREEVKEAPFLTFVLGSAFVGSTEVVSTRTALFQSVQRLLWSNFSSAEPAQKQSFSDNTYWI